MFSPPPPPPPKWRPGERERFDLVKIAFDKALEPGLQAAPESVGVTVVAYADAVLAAMEKPGAENDEQKGTT